MHLPSFVHCLGRGRSRCPSHLPFTECLTFLVASEPKQMIMLCFSSNSCCFFRTSWAFNLNYPLCFPCAPLKYFTMWLKKKTKQDRCLSSISPYFNTGYYFIWPLLFNSFCLANLSGRVPRAIRHLGVRTALQPLNLFNSCISYVEKTVKQITNVGFPDNCTIYGKIRF